MGINYLNMFTVNIGRRKVINIQIKEILKHFKTEEDFDKIMELSDEADECFDDMKFAFDVIGNECPYCFKTIKEEKYLDTSKEILDELGSLLKECKSKIDQIE